MKYYKIVCLVIFSLLIINCQSEARTIAIIYDDSESMYKNNRCFYANYAAQMLMAFLRKDDQFISVFMSESSNAKKWDIRSNRKNLINEINNNWKVKTNETPYTAIDTAVQEILKSNLSKEEQSWLIITTDGEFEKKLNKPVNRATVRKSAKSFLKRTKGKIRIVFFLIGKRAADQKTPKIWKEIVPNQIEIVKANNEHDIINKMIDIATMISGRDSRSTNIQLKGKSIVFNSIFPLRRITIIDQKQAGDPLIVEQIISPNRKQKIDYEHLDISNKELQLHSSVTHCTSNQMMPSGSYTIIFDNKVNGNSVNVLLDTGVDLSVGLYGIDGNKLQSNQGKYQFCLGQEIKIGAYFNKHGNKKNIQFTQNMLNKINISAILNNDKINMVHEKATGMFFSKMIPIGPGKKMSYIETSYPEYFSLKSNIMIIEGQKCLPRKIENSKITIPVSYTYSKEYQAITKKPTFNVKSSAGSVNSQDIITAYHIPEGIKLRIRGHEITIDHPEIKIPTINDGEKLIFEIFRNNKYKNDKKTEMEIKFLSLSNNSPWENHLTFKLVPTPRKIGIDFSKEMLNCPVDKIHQIEPLNIFVKVDGENIPKNEFQYWSIEYFENKLPIEIIPDETQSVFKFSPKPYLNCPCFTSTGKMEIKLVLQGPFSLERYERSITLNIEDTSWWIKCFPVIKKIIFALILIIWVIGILKKPRFAKGRVVTYKMVQDRVESRPRTVILASDWFNRWLIPYRSEKRTVKKITFLPGSTQGSITISKNQIRKNIYINGTLQDLSLKLDLKLDLNSTLTEERENRTDYYTYR